MFTTEEDCWIEMSINHSICETQGRIYEYMSGQGYDMEDFSDRYLSSSFCGRAMDTIYSRFQIEDERESADFYMPEIGHLLKKYTPAAYFDGDVAYWIGFTYRQLYIETGTPSSQICLLIPFQAMCRSYPGLHTVEQNMATDILCESVGLSKLTGNRICA